MLHESLLGILGGDAPEAGRGDLHLQFVAQLSIRLDAPGVENSDLIMLGDGLFRNDQTGKGLNVAGLGVDGAAQFAGGADGLLGR